MSLVNFKTASMIKIELEIDDWNNGNTEINVSNQLDIYVLESALETLKSNEKKTEEVYNELKGVIHNVTTLNLAYYLSTFIPEPLDSAWTD